MLGRVREVVLVGTAIALGAAAPARAGGATTERVSVGPHGRQADGGSGSVGVAISAGGRFVAFESYATNLVPGDTNERPDFFVHDRRTGTTERVSVGPGGVQADSESVPGGLSAGGRFVAFWSFATNLVPHDTNGVADMFVRDRRTGRTERVSVGPHGRQGDGGCEGEGTPISADGRFVAFQSFATNLVPHDTNGQADIFVHDRETGTTERVSVGPHGRQGDGTSGYWVAISARGRFVAFYSDATDLVPGGTNGRQHVFVHDRKTGRTELASLGRGGVEGNGDSGFPAISADGRFVAFSSFATNLVPGDTNGVTDIFVRDRETGKTERVSVGPHGRQGDNESRNASISADGRLVAFQSVAGNLVAGGSVGYQVFVHDRETGRTELVSLGRRGTQGNGGSGSYGLAISADGHSVAFASDATNLVPHDTNG